MSKNAKRDAAKVVAKSNELPRKTTKSPATSTSRQAKKQDSVEGERALKKTTKPSVSSTSPVVASKRLSPALHTTKNKEHERTTTKAVLRAGRQLQSTSVNAAKAKPNAVLDTFHNVTVSSPPQKRKAAVRQTVKAPANALDSDQGHDKPSAHKLRERALSRTLQPEEVVMLKRESAKQRIEKQILQETRKVQEPIAFEVTFDQTPAQKSTKSNEGESDNYSDDFESYESDFETGSSTPEEEPESEQTEQKHLQPEQANPSKEETLPIAATHINLLTEAPSLVYEVDDEEDSEPTQNPITVIQRDKEHQLDSGHYDLNVRHATRLSELSDSFDTCSNANSEQLDSGISSYGTATIGALEPHKSKQIDAFYGGYADFVRRPVVTRRGEELMRKVRFDQLQYDLLDMQPISYEGFMQTYGKVNSGQTATQTQPHNMHSECQTVELDMRNSWTQHPPHYASSGQQLVMSCSGEAELDGHALAHKQQQDEYERSMLQLHTVRKAQQQRLLEKQRQRLAKPNDFERLNGFLHSATLLVGKVLSLNTSHKQRQATPLVKTNSFLRTVSQGYVELQSNLLTALSVCRLFGSTRQQLMVTVHECLPESNVYRDDFANLLMVWSLTDISKPLRLLSTWAEVCRIEFCSEAPDVIVAGLRDGSVAMWDLRETYSYCSKLDGHLTHFAATQSVVPNLEPGNTLDTGAVVDVRSFRTVQRTGLVNGLITAHKAIQYASLNDSGLLTIWTLVDTTAGNGNVATASHEYNSPWARVKLLQSAICDLRSYLERRLLKSQANNKTKYMFQGNAHTDELNPSHKLDATMREQGLQGLRFTSIDTGCERIYVCSNRNFVLCCTKSLKPERFVRIALQESRFLFPTALCVLSNEDYLAVGLSNGSVMILNCNQRQRLSNKPPPTAAPRTAHPQPMAMPDPDTGKSCAIQNIILNERRSFEEDYDLRPDTAACLEMIHQPRRAYELRVYDQQLLLSGSGLRQHLVQSLVLSSNGWQLFALANGAVRTYDFYLDKEMTSNDSAESTNGLPQVTDIAVAYISDNTNHLVLLNGDGVVQLHTLK